VFAAYEQKHKKESFHFVCTMRRQRVFAVCQCDECMIKTKPIQPTKKMKSSNCNKAHSASSKPGVLDGADQCWAKAITVGSLLFHSYSGASLRALQHERRLC
jgi:hypothetical protein